MLPHGHRSRIGGYPAAATKTAATAAGAGKSHHSLELGILREILRKIHEDGRPGVIKTVAAPGLSTGTVRGSCRNRAAGIASSGPDVLTDMQGIPHDERGQIEQ